LRAAATDLPSSLLVSATELGQTIFIYELPSAVLRFKLERGLTPTSVGFAFVVNTSRLTPRRS
jgi:hypothetical protein